MTSHLDEGRIQELIDGEIPSPELPPIQAHLALCAECRARLEEARTIGAEADRLIETIDLSEPTGRVAPHVVPARRRTWTRNLAWAATLVIAAGTGYLARDMGVPSSGVASIVVDSPRNSRVAPSESVTAHITPAPAESRVTRRAAEVPAAPLQKQFQEPRGGFADDKERENGERKKVARDAPLVLNEAATTAAPEAATAQPAAPPAPNLATPLSAPALRSGGALKASAGRVDELIAGGVAADKLAVPPVEITFPEALKRLNGSLRLIEGLLPLRLEVAGPDVRVVYPLASGELVLAERLDNGKLIYRLIAPAGFPADSLDKLRARVRD